MERKAFKAGKFFEVFIMKVKMLDIRDDGQIQRPERISFFKSLRQGGHIKCLLLTALIIVCAGVIVWCRVARVSRLVINFQNFPVSSREKTSPCDEGYVYIPVAFMVMLYLVYLVECWHCSTRLELTYKVDVDDVSHYIEQMRESQPIIWWKAVSYHYIRRSRQVTRYRNGDAYTTSQLYYERVNSRASASCFEYAECGSKDISKRLVDLEKHPATKIRFSKGFAFATLDAAGDFEEQRMRFFRENETFDDYMEMREGLDLLGVNFQEYMVTFANKDQLPWYVSHAMFWVLSFFLLSWPLRVIIDFQTAYVHYQVTKLFGSNSATSPSSLLENQLSPNSTEDSIEMERVIADGLNFAPSYSEAVLIEPIHYFASSVESVLQMNQLQSGHRLPRRHSLCRSDGRETIPPPPTRNFPKSISQPFRPLQDFRRINFSRLFPRWQRETPPCYEDAVSFSYPLVRYMSLRRSATERDLSSFRPPPGANRSWSSLFNWRKRNNETAL